MENKIDQSMIPQRTLNSGEKIPCMGLGTFGSDKYGAEAVSNAVYGAIKYGYRLIDCASVYQNEEQIGQVLQRIFQEKIVERKSCLSPQKCGTICMERERCWNPAERVCRIWDLIILTCILSIGLFQIIMHRDVTEMPEIRIPGPLKWRNS